MTQRPSRCWMSSTVRRTSSSRRSPQPSSSPKMARSRLPFKVSGSGSANKPAGLFPGKPVPCPGTFGPGAGDLGDAGGEFGREQSIVGRFGGELPHAASWTLTAEADIV